jgi:hypothetical protein
MRGKWGVDGGGKLCEMDGVLWIGVVCCGVRGVVPFGVVWLEWCGVV